jgi:hypothetical protein
MKIEYVNRVKRYVEDYMPHIDVQIVLNTRNGIDFYAEYVVFECYNSRRSYVSRIGIDRFLEEMSKALPGVPKFNPDLTYI